MELAELRIFQAVAETGSIARAAELLNRVPSNLSTRLRQLEDKLGVDLFERERQRLHLSPAGTVLLGYSQRLFALADEARAAVQDGAPAGAFVLGSMYSTAAIHLPAMIAAYHQQYLSVELQLQTGPSGELIDGLLQGRLDAALVDGPARHDGLEGVPLFEEPMVLVTGADHPPVHSAADVAGRPVFTFRTGHFWNRGQHPDHYLGEQAGIAPDGAFSNHHQIGRGAVGLDCGWNGGGRYRPACLAFMDALRSGCNRRVDRCRDRYVAGALSATSCATVRWCLR